MFLFKMASFSKNVTCPESQTLLDFSQRKHNSAESSELYTHLSECEFCAAECDLYVDYPELDEPVQVTEIPQHLFELAEVLLSDKEMDSTLLERLANNGGKRLRGSPA